MKQTELTYRAPDGADLHIRGWLCGGPVAIVHIIHGMAEHGARYAHVAEALNNANFHVYAHDHRGHGQSLVDGQPLGHLADKGSWSLCVQDAHSVRERIAQEHPGLPIVALGHSMGSFVLQQSLYQYPDDYVAAALSASNGKPGALGQVGRVVGRVERLRVGKRKPSPVIQAMTFGEFNKAFDPTRTEFDWLSRDPEQVDAYIMDPLCGFACTTQTWVDFLDGLFELASPENVAKVPKDKPLYLFAGGEDPVGEKGVGVRRLRDQYLAAGLTNVSLKLYPDARHETVNETNRLEVIGDLVAWCSRVV